VATSCTSFSIPTFRSTGKDSRESDFQGLPVLPVSAPLSADDSTIPRSRVRMRDTALAIRHRNATTIEPAAQFANAPRIALRCGGGRNGAQHVARSRMVGSRFLETSAYTCTIQLCHVLMIQDVADDGVNAER
jgi:hypothetical protein